MEFLENDFIKISIHPKGAELTNFIEKTSGTEYIWDGNPAFWAKHSPILFPIVGALKDETYLYKGTKYKLGRHGFARDMVFEVSERKNSSITFSLKSSKETLEKFPFEFELQIEYRLEEKSLLVSYKVVNTSNEAMYFSIGGHPAFKLPITVDTEYNDYYIEFEKEETAGRWPISNEGLIDAASIPLLNGKKLPLTKALFQKDALVFKHLQSTSLKLKSDKTKEGFQFEFKEFPYLGIWAAKNANFICIEPWCGIADNIDSTQIFTEKEGINKLASNESFERNWSISLF